MREALAARSGRDFVTTGGSPCAAGGRTLAGLKCGAAVRSPASDDRARLRHAACGAHGRRLECARMADRASPLADVPAQGRARAAGRGRAAAAAVRGRPRCARRVPWSRPRHRSLRRRRPGCAARGGDSVGPPPARDPIGDLIRAGETGSAAAKESLDEGHGGPARADEARLRSNQERRRDRTGHAPGDREVRARAQARGHGRTQPPHRARARCPVRDALD